MSVGNVMDNLHLASESSVLTHDIATTAIAHGMDDEMTNSALSNLEIQRNFVCFIHLLPTEILEAIFIHCACDYYGLVTLVYRVSRPTAPSWVNVSYVCRHWRSVALNCPTLWTYLSTTSPRWTEAFLCRSKQASLKVVVHVNSKNEVSRFMEKVVKHSERIQELLVHLSTGHHEFLSKLSSPAPRLQRLEITMDNLPWEGSYVPFNGDTPALRTLYLKECLVPWHSLKLSGLTSLCLRNVPSRFQQDMPELLATLSCMQDLTQLFLKKSLPTSAGFLSSTTFNAFQKIDLPRLSRFSIANRLSKVNVFLSCVNIPLQTEVRLLCGINSSALEHYALLSSFLAQRFAMFEDQALSSPTIRSLVTTSSEKVTKLTFSTPARDCDSSISPSCIEWDRNIPLQIILFFNRFTTNHVRDGIIRHICCAIPLSEVHSVHVICPAFYPTIWWDILGRLQGVRYIKLGKVDITDLVLMFSRGPRDYMENQAEHANRGQSEIFAPALEELEFYDVVFSTALEEDMDPLKVTSVQNLCDALATRKEPRGRLTMTRCTVRNVHGREKQFDMVGGWEGGHFHVVDLKGGLRTRRCSNLITF
ncbi:hypothetical protein OG21DRAFT_1496338 [Imleria badia]|nr:hypothetical protein OG21DRAFT_1496338 [Imleria badia]